MEDNWVKHPTTLHGNLVDLAPMEEAHFPELLAAAADQRIWEFYISNLSIPEKFNKAYTTSIALREKGLEYPFVIILKATGAIIGTTRLMEMGAYDRRLEIGGTWLIPEYWATAINLDCKLALLTFCFEELEANRIQLKTQDSNIRSRKAIEKIGGKFEGIVRQHILKDNGIFRSSAMFSLLAEEWPEVKSGLKKKLTDKLNELK